MSRYCEKLDACLSQHLDHYWICPNSLIIFNDILQAIGQRSDDDDKIISPLTPKSISYIISNEIIIGTGCKFNSFFGPLTIENIGSNMYKITENNYIFERADNIYMVIYKEDPIEGPIHLMEWDLDIISNLEHFGFDETFPECDFGKPYPNCLIRQPFNRPLTGYCPDRFAYDKCYNIIGAFDDSGYIIPLSSYDMLYLMDIRLTIGTGCQIYMANSKKYETIEQISIYKYKIISSGMVFKHTDWFEVTHVIDISTGKQRKLKDSEYDDVAKFGFLTVMPHSIMSAEEEKEYEDMLLINSRTQKFINDDIELPCSSDENNNIYGPQDEIIKSLVVRNIDELQRDRILYISKVYYKNLINSVSHAISTLNDPNSIKKVVCLKDKVFENISRDITWITGQYGFKDRRGYYSMSEWDKYGIEPPFKRAQRKLLSIGCKLVDNGSSTNPSLYVSFSSWN